MDGDNSKRPRKEDNNSTSTPTSPGDVFEESLKKVSQLYAEYRETGKIIIFTSSRK